MAFPVFRKYPNNKSFFKVVSHERFEEIKVTGNKAGLFVFEAKIFPDRMLIQDMIAMEKGFWVESSKEEFQAMLKRL